MKFIPETALDHLVVHIKQHHKTQTAAAKAWGLGPGYLSSIINGQRPIPKSLLDVIGWEWRLVPKERTEGGEQWDAAHIRQPGWYDVFAAFIAGANEARANPDATGHDFTGAADGYTRRVFEQVDQVSEAALRTGSWKTDGGER